MVSVIIPTYNREKFIKRALESVLNQTYKDIEIVVVDDNSSDNTHIIMKDYMEKYDFIKYIKHDVNKGGSAARNTGVKEANGEIIAFLDSDDEWVESKLEKCVKVFEENKDISLIYSDVYLIDEDTKKTQISYKKSFEDPFYELMKRNIIGGNSSVVVRKDDFFKAGGFKDGLPSCQDWNLFLDIIRNGKIYRIPEPLTKYYVHMNSISGNVDKVIKGHKYMLDKVTKLIDKDGYYSNDRNKILSEQHITIAQLYVDFGKFKEAKHNYFKALKLDLRNLKAIKNCAACIFGEKMFYKIKRDFSKGSKVLAHRNV